MLALPPPRPHKRLSLTPMIDVVFLLLVFFMLASQFGVDRVLPMAAGGDGSGYSGPPRLVTIELDGVFLNGIRTDPEALPTALSPLTTTNADVIVLRPAAGVPLQSLMDVASALRQGGYSSLMVME